MRINLLLLTILIIIKTQVSAQNIYFVNQRVMDPIKRTQVTHFSDILNWQDFWQISDQITLHQNWGIEKFAPNHLIAQIKWSNDGNKIGYLVYSFKNDRIKVELRVSSIPEKESWVVAEGEINFTAKDNQVEYNFNNVPTERFFFSPKGNIYFQLTSSTSAEVIATNQIWRFNFSDKPIKVTENGDWANVIFSPTGERIAFNQLKTRPPQGQKNIPKMVILPNQTQEVYLYTIAQDKLEKTPMLGTPVDWKNNQKITIISSPDEKGLAKLVNFNPETQEVENVGKIFYPYEAYHPNGKIFYRSENNSISLCSADGQKSRVIIKTNAVPDGWSSDGSLLYYLKIDQMTDEAKKLSIPAISLWTIAIESDIDWEKPPEFPQLMIANDLMSSAYPVTISLNQGMMVDRIAYVRDSNIYFAEIAWRPIDTEEQAYLDKIKKDETEIENLTLSLKGIYSAIKSYQLKMQGKFPDKDRWSEQVTEYLNAEDKEKFVKEKWFGFNYVGSDPAQITIGFIPLKQGQLILYGDGTIKFNRF
jgi:hypothetical protein